jgi:hypothetical protein
MTVAKKQNTQPERIEQPPIEEVVAWIRKNGLTPVITEGADQAIAKTLEGLRPFPQNTVLLIKDSPIKGQYCLIAPTELESEFPKFLYDLLHSRILDQG